jgi:NAD(P)-dependent dehydrogenase (short-subunit alcohol dehydrogenase family)
MNVLDRDALEKFFQEEGEYDILVNSATGGARAVGPFLSMDLDGYKASFDKLWGYTNVVRYGTKYLKDHGNIVLVSGSPARKCRPGQIAISSVGGAVEAFARGIAPEIAPKRINIVSPGIIDTPMSPLQGKEREDYYKNTTNNNLIPRAGTPDEVATGIIFAIENEFITGTIIDIDGGWLIS